MCLEHPINRVTLVQLLSNLDSFSHSGQKHVAGQHVVTWQKIQIILLITVGTGIYCRWIYKIFIENKLFRSHNTANLCSGKEKNIEKNLSSFYFADIYLFCQPNTFGSGQIHNNSGSGSDPESNGSYRSVSGIMLKKHCHYLQICHFSFIVRNKHVFFINSTIVLDGLSEIYNNSYVPEFNLKKKKNPVKLDVSHTLHWFRTSTKIF